MESYVDPALKTFSSLDSEGMGILSVFPTFLLPPHGKIRGFCVPRGGVFG